MSEKRLIAFAGLSATCEHRVVTEAWFDQNKIPLWDWTCTIGDIDSENPKLPVLGKERECCCENCPIWHKLDRGGI